MLFLYWLISDVSKLFNWYIYCSLFSCMKKSSYIYIYTFYINIISLIFCCFPFWTFCFFLIFKEMKKIEEKYQRNIFFSWIEVVDVKDRRSIIINNITWKSSNWDWRKLKWSYIIEAPLIISICFIVKYIQFKILHNYYF